MQEDNLESGFLRVCEKEPVVENVKTEPTGASATAATKAPKKVVVPSGPAPAPTTGTKAAALTTASKVVAPPTLKHRDREALAMKYAELKSDAINELLLINTKILVDHITINQAEREDLAQRLERATVLFKVHEDMVGQVRKSAERMRQSFSGDVDGLDDYDEYEYEEVEVTVDGEEEEEEEEDGGGVGGGSRHWRYEGDSSDSESDTERAYLGQMGGVVKRKGKKTQPAPQAQAQAPVVDQSDCGVTRAIW